MKRTFALLLSALLTLSAALPVLADDRTPAGAGSASSAVSSQSGASSSGASSAADGEAEGTESVGGETPAEDALTGGSAVDGVLDVLTADSVHSAALAAENTAGTVNFENLRAALRKYNETVMSMEGQIKDLADTSTSTGSMWDLIVLLGQMKDGVEAALDSLDEEALGDAYKPLYTTLNSQVVVLDIQTTWLKSQRTSIVDASDSIESAKNNLNDGINQLVKGAETLYIAIDTMESGLDAMNRGMDTLDRAVVIVEKQQELGMASAYDVESMRHQRSQLQSQIETMKYQIASNKVTLEGMLDMELNGSVKLGALPMPSEAELDAVDYDKQLSTGMNRNVDVVNAQMTYDSESNGTNRHALNAAKDNYAAKFKAACMAIPENRRLVTAAQETLDFQQRTFDIAAKKYELGMASHEDYLSAQSTLDSAKDDLTTAQRNLFTAYRTCVWATQYGLV